MHWLAHVLLAETDSPVAPLDPKAIEALVNAILTLVGTGGASSVAALAIAYFVREWLRTRRRDSGNDPEHTAKQETRTQIKEQGDSLARVAASTENTSRIQQRMLEELSVMRRESYEAHADIKAALKER